MPKFVDRTGQRYGRLTVTGPYRSGGYWTCMCDCGTSTEVYGGSLTQGLTRSCGCYKREVTIERNHSHRMASRKERIPEYTVWVLMRRRCGSPQDVCYDRYGGRGIKVCDRWASFKAFYEDMGPRPTPDHQIDRIDNEGPYSPENCRWASRVEQCNNRSDNRLITYRGETKTLMEWSRATGIKPHTIAARIDRLKWDIERSLTAAVRPMRRRVKA